MDQRQDYAVIACKCELQEVSNSVCNYGAQLKHMGTDLAKQYENLGTDLDTVTFWVLIRFLSLSPCSAYDFVHIKCTNNILLAKSKFAL